MFSAACFDLSIISSGKVNGRGQITNHNSMFKGLMEPSLRTLLFLLVLISTVATHKLPHWLTWDLIGDSVVPSPLETKPLKTHSVPQIFLRAESVSGSGFQTFLLLTSLLELTEHLLPCWVIVAESKWVTWPYSPILFFVSFEFFLIRIWSMANSVQEKESTGAYSYMRFYWYF